MPEREVLDQTGLTGVYDFELDLGFLPLAAIASVHPTLALDSGRPSARFRRRSTNSSACDWYHPMHRAMSR